jgi:hypothetical protein
MSPLITLLVNILLWYLWFRLIPVEAQSRDNTYRKTTSYSENERKSKGMYKEVLEH